MSQQLHPSNHATLQKRQDQDDSQMQDESNHQQQDYEGNTYKYQQQNHDEMDVDDQQVKIEDDNEGSSFYQQTPIIKQEPVEERSSQEQHQQLVSDISKSVSNSLTNSNQNSNSKDKSNNNRLLSNPLAFITGNNNPMSSFQTNLLRDTSGLVYPPTHLKSSMINPTSLVQHHQPHNHPYGNNFYLHQSSLQPPQQQQQQQQQQQPHQQHYHQVINNQQKHLQATQQQQQQEVTASHVGYPGLQTHQQPQLMQQQQLELEEILLKLRQITQSLKPPELQLNQQIPQHQIRSQSLQQTPIQGQPPQTEQDQIDDLWEWLQSTLSVERFNCMAENIEKLEETQLIQKAKEIELLALKLDIDQANEINRGKEYNIIKKQ
eukprot:403369118